MTPQDGLAEWLAGPIAAAARRASAATGSASTLVVGISGSQGSGKSTLAAKLPARIEAAGLRAVVLSLDDVYLTKAERQRLAKDVHPLFATRGVPGTHGVPLGADTIMSLSQPGLTVLPRFDKGRDDRLDEREWPIVRGPFDVILFEGWCVGARPQPAAALADPINELERRRDREGVWRRRVNDYLASSYISLFSAIGFQVQLLAPRFETVLGWREQQEHERIARGEPGQSDAELAVFVQYYERLTRWMAEEMPARADVVARLDEQREVVALEGLALGGQASG